MLRFAALFALLALAALGCDEPSPPHLYGPGPSSLVTRWVIPSSALYGLPDVTCEGAPADVAALGVLCDGTARVFGPSFDVGDVSFYVGDAERGPKILVYGYFGQDGPYDHARDIRYAAYFVRSAPAVLDDRDWGSLLILSKWDDGEILTGEVATAEAGRTCGITASGIATFQVDSVTVTVVYELEVGC